MNVREELLANIRKATESLPSRAELPSKEAVAALTSRLVPPVEDADTLAEAFASRWKEASGVIVYSVSELRDFLESEKVKLGYVDPKALPLLQGESLPNVVSEYDRAKVDEIDFGVSAADFAVAETGTISLSDQGTTNRIGALAPWIHVAVLKRSDIVAKLGQGVDRFGDDPSIVFITGPSKTADIEGILIEGVHGPGRQVVLLV